MLQSSTHSLNTFAQWWNDSGTAWSLAHKGQQIWGQTKSNILNPSWCKLTTRKISPRVWFGPTPQPVTVTTRIIRFLVGNPFKPSFNDCYWWLFVRFSAEADYTAPELEARQSAKPWIHVFNMALSKIALIQRDWRCSMKRPSGASFICQRLKIWAESETFYSVTIDFWVDQVPTAASDVYSAGVAMAKAVSIRVIFPPAAATWLMMSGLYGNRPTSLILFASQSLPLVYTFWLALIMGVESRWTLLFFCASLWDFSDSGSRIWWLALCWVNRLDTSKLILFIQDSIIL